VYDAKIFAVESVTRESADGRRAEFVRVASPDWVNAIAVVPDVTGRECFVLVRQFRQGAGRVTLEFPGGIVDNSEDPKAAAIRELHEETGYVANNAVLLGTTNPNPAFMTNTVHTYLALDVEDAHQQSLDENEIVDRELVPVDEVLSLRHSEFNVHAIMLAALGWYANWRKASAPDGRD
jgi:8-oxo-dGTP pyrophosphatase MutT (NUDIX family)